MLERRLSRRRLLRGAGLAAATLAAAPVLAACGSGADDDSAGTATSGASPSAASNPSATAGPTEKASGSIILYAGRTEALIKPLVELFQKSTGVTVSAKYGDTAQLAALLIEEGNRSPADVYLAQDAGALGAVAGAGLLANLPGILLERVSATFRAQNNQWVGVSGRARVISYNADLVAAAELPKSYKELTAAKWKGQVGWAPTNASFQAFVTAIRRLESDASAEKWLKDMVANDAKVFAGNLPIVTAVNKGEIKLGLANQYYLFQLIKAEGDGVKARNHFTANGDAGSLVNVAGTGILKTAKNKPAAQAFVDYLLSGEAQKYFVEQTYEYPVIQGLAADPRLKPLAELKPPMLDLSRLDDLQGTLALLRTAGVLT